MPGHPPSAPAPRRQVPQRILGYPAHVTLSALMSLAVVVLERRISKALRANAGPDRQASRKPGPAAGGRLADKIPAGAPDGPG